jgi:hypothetical protein
MVPSPSDKNTWIMNKVTKKYAGDTHSRNTLCDLVVGTRYPEQDLAFFHLFSQMFQKDKINR